jgi:hypothetical protein
MNNLCQGKFPMSFKETWILNRMCTPDLANNDMQTNFIFNHIILLQAKDFPCLLVHFQSHGIMAILSTTTRRYVLVYFSNMEICPATQMR